MSVEKLDKLETLKKEYAEIKVLCDIDEKWLEWYKAKFKAGQTTEDESKIEEEKLVSYRNLLIKLKYLETEIKSLERQHILELEKVCYTEILQRIDWLEKIE